MATVTFQTTVDHGNIRIPQKLHDQIKGDVEVSITVKKAISTKAKNFLREMIENPILDPDFVPLTRDEIYDRT